MNKKYKSAFSAVCPSESSVERIFNMAKKKKITFKPFLIAAIVSTLMAISLISANAATDGVIAEKAEQVVEKAVESVNVLINGEKINSDDINYKHTSEIVDGKEINRYTFDFEKEKVGEGEFVFEIDEDGANISGYHSGETDLKGFSIEEVNEIGEKTELQVPTTSEGE